MAYNFKPGDLLEHLRYNCEPDGTEETASKYRVDVDYKNAAKEGRLYILVTKVEPRSQNRDAIQIANGGIPGTASIYNGGMNIYYSDFIARNYKVVAHFDIFEEKGPEHSKEYPTPFETAFMAAYMSAYGSLKESFDKDRKKMEEDFEKRLTELEEKCKKIESAIEKIECKLCMRTAKRCMYDDGK